MGFLAGPICIGGQHKSNTRARARGQIAPSGGSTQMNKTTVVWQRRCVQPRDRIPRSSSVCCCEKGPQQSNRRFESTRTNAICEYQKWVGGGDWSSPARSSRRAVCKYAVAASWLCLYSAHTRADQTTHTTLSLPLVRSVSLSPSSALSNPRTLWATPNSTRTRIATRALLSPPLYYHRSSPRPRPTSTQVSTSPTSLESTRPIAHHRPCLLRTAAPAAHPRRAAARFGYGARPFFPSRLSVRCPFVPPPPRSNSFAVSSFLLDVY